MLVLVSSVAKEAGVGPGMQEPSGEQSPGGSGDGGEAAGGAAHYDTQLRDAAQHHVGAPGQHERPLDHAEGRDRPTQVPDEPGKGQSWKPVFFLKIYFTKKK